MDKSLNLQRSATRRATATAPASASAPQTSSPASATSATPASTARLKSNLPISDKKLFGAIPATSSPNLSEPLYATFSPLDKEYFYREEL